MNLAREFNPLLPFCFVRDELRLFMSEGVLAGCRANLPSSQYGNTHLAGWSCYLQSPAFPDLLKGLLNLCDKIACRHHYESAQSRDYTRRERFHDG